MKKATKTVYIIDTQDDYELEVEIKNIQGMLVKKGSYTICMLEKNKTENFYKINKEDWHALFKIYEDQPRSVVKATPYAQLFERCDEATLDRLSMEDWPIKTLIAEHVQNLPSRILNRLTRDAEFIVRLTVAKRPDLPDDLLWFLGGDPTWQVRAAIAAKHHLPEGLIKDRAHDIDWRVRKELAIKPNLSDEIIEILSKDPCSKVQEIIKEKRGNDA